MVAAHPSKSPGRPPGSRRGPAVAVGRYDPPVHAADTTLETTLRPALPVHLGLTLGPLRRGHDPSVLVEPSGAWWRATRTPEGPATARYAASGGTVRVQAWGPGAAWCLETAGELLGTRDRLDGFEPHGLVRELHRRLPGLRITRSLAVFEALVPSILEQKVAGKEARASYRAVVRAWGAPAPGPVPLRLPPGPDVLAAKAYWQFHPLGVEMKRANTIRAAAGAAARLEEATAMAPGDAHRRLQAIAGVGPWTAAEVAIVALGDADAVSVGDYHLPHLVSWQLAGEPRGTDERMLELLAPYAGHRGRVLRLLQHAGQWAPRFGPRMPLRSFRRY
jgi:3-methyladenine DNA glycosylase/8-oxoguanine DNA glycosylase